MLFALGEDVVHLRDEFPRDISDIELFESLSQSHFVFVSADRKILTRPAETRALKQAKVTSLFLSQFFSKKQFWSQADWLVHQWPKIRGFAEGCQPGTCAIVSHNGKSQLISLD